MVVSCSITFTSTLMNLHLQLSRLFTLQAKFIDGPGTSSHQLTVTDVSCPPSHFSATCRSFPPYLLSSSPHIVSEPLRRGAARQSRTLSASH